jgi:hypothetical protein
MKIYGDRRYSSLLLFLNLAVDGGEWSDSNLGCIIPGERVLVSHHM